MVWNKLKQQLEGLLAPTLIGVVEYRVSGYKYTSDKSANCYLTVNKEEIFNMKCLKSQVVWYKTEQEAKGDDDLKIYVSSDDIEKVRVQSGGKIPEDRLKIIAYSHKLADYAKEVLTAQSNLTKTDFQKIATIFLTTSIDKCLDSDDIILNVLAIVDRRVGKNRLRKMAHIMQMKHPVVRYFYDLRLNSKN